MAGKMSARTFSRLLESSTQPSTKVTLKKWADEGGRSQNKRDYMSEDIDWSRLTKIDDTHFATPEHETETNRLAALAKNYLNSQKWCKLVQEVYLGLSEAGIIGVFLCRVVSFEDGERWLWVIVGDIPFLYISTKFARNQYQALNSYVGEIDAWISAIRSGSPDESLAPVSWDTETGALEVLRNKLDVLERQILDPAKYLLD
jgi:hypothetical protein